MHRQRYQAKKKNSDGFRIIALASLSVFVFSSAVARFWYNVA
jgi:hypothetical protein